MSLYEVSDGILETHVTWEDVEMELQEKLETKASFGENKTAINISDMKGYMSRIALVDPDWIGAEPHENLPQKLAVKISSQIPLLALSKVVKYDGDNGFGEEKLKKLGVLIREGHNREVETYKMLEKFNHPHIPYTKVYGMKKFSSPADLKGFLILEFIPNVHHLGSNRPIPHDELRSVIRGISTFSALSENLSSDEKDFVGGPDYLEILFNQIFTKSSLQKNFASIHQVFDEKDHKNVDKLIEVLWIYHSLLEKYTRISEILGMKSVLNHGDLWQSNMIHTLGKEGKLKLEAIIDWQNTVLLPPGLDTSRLMMECLSARDRREHGPELLQLYYETFTEVAGKEVFSMEELHDSYNLYFPMAAMLIIPESVGFMINAQITEEERKIAMEKITAVMEDVLEVHQTNLKKFPDLMKV